MRNHDTALVLGLWAATAAAWALLHLRDRRHRDNPNPIHPRPHTRAELVAITHDTSAPSAIRIIAAAQLHANGWCSCHTEPYDQDAEITTDDLDWLTSQDGTP